MKAVLLRTGSVPVQASLVLGSPRVSFSGQDPVTGILFSGENKNNAATLRSPPSLHLEFKEKKDDVTSRGIRRAMSESDMRWSVNVVSGRLSKLTGAGSRSFPARIPEEEEILDADADGGISCILKRDVIGRGNSAGIWRERDFREEFEFSGGGTGKGKKIGGGNGGGGSGDSSNGGGADQSKISAYYQEMLKANPGNPLLLRNYGRFLHEVENDVVRAEEYYGRAILASPGDGEVLSLYGKLIWETHRDEDRAKTYFDQAVQASPDDCFVLGSYAHFLWDAEEDEDEEEIKGAQMSAALVEAY